MKLLVCISAILCFSSCLQAAEVPMADPDLPQPIDFSFADDLLLHSPFTRAVNLEKSLQLTGIAYVDERPVATVLNTETKPRFVMTEEPNVQGWQLMTASAGADMHQTQVELKVGDEIIAMHYQGQQLSPGSAGNERTSKTRLAGSNKVKPSSFLGEQGRKMYASLSPEARDKFKDLMKSRMEKHPELTPEQNSDYAQKVFAKLKATDPASAGGGKVPKPPKKKQGA